MGFDGADCRGAESKARDRPRPSRGGWRGAWDALLDGARLMLREPVTGILLLVNAIANGPWSVALQLAITLIVLEFSGRRGTPRLGAALLSILLIARMCESDLSLLAKGLAFIGIGVAFLVFNIFMGRLKARLTPPQP